MTYIHEHQEWPNFQSHAESLASQLATVRHKQGRLIGRMEGLGFALREEAVLETLTEDVLKSSDQSRSCASMVRHDPSVC
jgi:hypothetical protein